MTTPMKLASFAAVLAVIFGAAAFAGGAVARIHNPAAAAKDEKIDAFADCRGLACTASRGQPATRATRLATRLRSSGR
jgi:hypothetical protein